MKKNKRYWIFGFNGFYPNGGMNDFQFSFDTVDEYGDEVLKMKKYDAYQLLDTKSEDCIQTVNLNFVTMWVCRNVVNNTSRGC